MTTTVFTTKSRKLEQFLYAHAIDFISSGKDLDDGMTYWSYTETDEVLRIVAEYREALRRREIMKKGA